MRRGPNPRAAAGRFSEDRRPRSSRKAGSGAKPPRSGSWKRGQCVDAPPSSPKTWRSSSSGKRGARSGGGGRRSNGGPPPARINIAREVKLLRENCRSERDFLRGLKSINSMYHIHMDLLMAHSVHAAAETDDLKLMEFLMRDNTLSDEAREKLVNRVMGRHSYTPLCRAAYAGSLDMIKLLISMGADVRFKNAHDEDLETCLDAGCQTQIEKLPELEIFIRPRYEDCRVFISRRRKWLEDQENRKSRPKAVRFRPQVAIRNDAANTIRRWWRDRHWRRRRREVRSSEGAGGPPPSPAP